MVRNTYLWYTYMILQKCLNRVWRCWWWWERRYSDDAGVVWIPLPHPLQFSPGWHPFRCGAIRLPSAFFQMWRINSNPADISRSYSIWMLRVNLLSSLAKAVCRLLSNHKCLLISFTSLLWLPLGSFWCDFFNWFQTFNYMVSVCFSCSNQNTSEANMVELFQQVPSAERS